MTMREEPDLDSNDEKLQKPVRIKQVKWTKYDNLFTI